MVAHIFCIKIEIKMTIYQYLAIDIIAMRTQKNLSKTNKDRIAMRQRFKCANYPGSQLKHLENFDCPLWQYNGNFAESGFEVDHITEFADGCSDNDDLQALGMDCFASKTKNIVYQCRICGYKTSLESRYSAHLKRKTPCKKNIMIPLIDNSNEEINMDLDVGNYDL